MWRPQTWQDIIDALGVLSEGQTLDFKEAVTQGAPAEIAKDFVAMSIDGGTIAYGIGETNEIADRITATPLAGKLNQLSQSVDSHAFPRLNFDAYPLENPANAGLGIVIVNVPQSPLAPHMVGGQYPVRFGTTTRNLTEREVEDLYLRRFALTASGDDREILAGFSSGLGAINANPKYIGTQGVGMMRVSIGPVAGRVAYADHGFIRTRLTLAVGLAHEQAQALLHQAFVPDIVSLISWKPTGTEGWLAGSVGSHRDENLARPYYGGALSYVHGLSFLVTYPLEHAGKRHAHEWIWAQNLVGMVAIAGHFFGDETVASLLRLDVALDGLQKVVLGPRQDRFDGPVFSVPAYKDRQLVACRDATNDPLAVARRSLDRLFAAGNAGDVFADISR